MRPKTKILVFTFGLILPYMAVVLYFALRIQERPLPTWFPYFGLSYIFAAIIAVMVFSRKVHRATPADQREQVKPFWRWLARAWMAYLVAVWSGFFLWGVYLTLRGTLVWQRAVPAGAFLLMFIALFSWALYKDFRRPAKETQQGDEKMAGKI